MDFELETLPVATLGNTMGCGSSTQVAPVNLPTAVPEASAGDDIVHQPTIETGGEPPPLCSNSMLFFLREVSTAVNSSRVDCCLSVLLVIVGPMA